MLFLIIISIPFISFLISFFSDNSMPKLYIIRLSTFLMGINLLHVLFLANQMFTKKENYYIDLGPWIDCTEFTVRWNFYLDNLTLMMLILVSTISFLVHLFSLEYMQHDFNVKRFFSYLSLFTFFMIVLVSGDNFLILFLGWEGVGLCSYLLISFWYTRIQANKAALKALIVNRISDFAFILGLAYIYKMFNSLDFGVIFPLIPFYQNQTVLFLGFEINFVTLISVLLFIGAMGKSAQIGLHTWLPDAMEGPTPVSALIHAATMVTAGVFLIIKCSFIFEYAPNVLFFVTFIGGLTAFFSSTIGLIQNDIKKVIAYSTCSQLGYMVFSCGISAYNLAFFHLINHAFFKALLFLSAGSIIHSLSNEQDMRKYGGLINLLPFTATMFLIGSLSLMGFPFLTGFYSKDLIIEVAFAKYTVQGSFCYTLGLLTAFFTSIYSYRVFYLTFIYNSNSFHKMIVKTHELSPIMFIVLSVLALGSIFLGYLGKDLFVGFGTDFWNNNIYILPKNNLQFEAEFIPLWIKFLPFTNSLLAIIFLNYIFEKLTIINFYSFKNNSYNYKNIYSFLTYKWYFDAVYNKCINLPVVKFAYDTLYKLIDKGLLEIFGPSFLVKNIMLFALKIKRFQTGRVYHYGYFIILSLVLNFIVICFFV